jgi:hypothetical protein
MKRNPRTAAADKAKLLSAAATEHVAPAAAADVLPPEAAPPVVPPEPAGGVPLAAATDATGTAPAVTAAVPLPSDQISATRVPAAEFAPGAGAVAAEPPSPPLPSPTLPEGDVVSRAAHAALVHVDGSVPLPSDQLTPLVRAEAITDGAAAIRRALEDAIDDGVLGSLDHAALAIDAGFGRLHGKPDVFDLLRRDLSAAGFGVVILAADTVERLRDELELPPIAPGQPRAAAERDLDEPRRTFPVTFDVEHDGVAVPPGDRVAVTHAEFVRLRSGTAIAAGTEWLDGEEA